MNLSRIALRAPRTSRPAGLILGTGLGDRFRSSQGGRGSLKERAGRSSERLRHRKPGQEAPVSDPPTSPFNLHGKEAVPGSSPGEGSKIPAQAGFSVFVAQSGTAEYLREKEGVGDENGAERPRTGLNPRNTVGSISDTRVRWIRGQVLGHFRR